MDNIFLTGATGFIGSHVAEILCEKGEKISCLVRKNSNLEHLKTLPINMVYGDITNPEQLHEVIKQTVIGAKRPVTDLIKLAEPSVVFVIAK